jgi:iron complex outermembrane receptor protein
MSSLSGALDPLLAGLNGLSALTAGFIASIASNAHAVQAGTEFDHLAVQEQQSFALFAQFDCQFTDELTIIAGIRYTDESKDLATEFIKNLPSDEVFPTFFASTTELVMGAGVAGAALGNIGAALTTGQVSSAAGCEAIRPFQTLGWRFDALSATTAARPNIVESLADDQIIGTLKLSWQPNWYNLVHASCGTGYKSGDTNTDHIANGFAPLFDAETSESFELGVKKDFQDYDLRINAAAHYTSVENFQASTFTGNGFNLQNAGDYEISGFEMAATWLPVDSLEVNFAWAFVNAEYKTFKGGNCWVTYTWQTRIDDPSRQNATDQFCDRSGDRPGGEPKHHAVISVKKDFELIDGVYSYVQGDFSYTSEIILDGSNDIFAVQGSHNVVNFRLFINFENADINVVVWARNLLNEEYINRTNVNAPLQTGKLNACMAEPPTFWETVKNVFNPYQPT